MYFTVNGTKWNLEFVKPSSHHLQRSDGTWTIGVSNNHIKSVFIANNLSEYMTDKVICHELCHVYSFENHLDIPIQTEEIIADFMSKFGRDIIYLADNIMGKILRRTA